MPLTPAQLATLKSHVLANTTSIGGVQIKDMPLNDDANLAIANWYNLTASPAYLAWSTEVPIKSIRGATDLSKFTPADSVPASGATAQVTNDQLLYQNRALVCQLKQANAVFLIQGEGTVDATLQQFRLSFNDCMSGIPSGAGGTNTNAGWGTPAAPGAVRLAMQRNVTNAEKVFSTQPANSNNAGNVNVDGRGVATNPDALVVVGAISPLDVFSARVLP